MPPTKAELWDQLGKALDITDTAFKFFSGEGPTVPNFLADTITLQDVFEGNHIGNTQQVLDSIRNNASNIVVQGVALLQYIIAELAKIGYYSISSSISDLLDDIYDGMQALGETITSRAFTFGVLVVGGANIGDGVIYRLTKDRNNHDLEHAAAYAGITKIEIIADRYTGRSSGTEQAKLYGYGTTSQDVIEQGTCPDEVGTLISYRAQNGKLANASFDSYAGAGAGFTLTNWTLSAPANFSENVALYFRKTPGSTTGVSLEFADNGNIEQKLTVNSVVFDKSKPVFLIVRYYRKTNCDGTLTIKLGSQTEAINLATVANATWIDITLGTGTNRKGWYDMFAEDNAGVKLTLAGRTVGTLLVDEIILVQPTKYDGKYYLLVAGGTDFLKDDYWTFTDTVLNTGRIQYMVSKLYGKYLPHTAGVPTYVDP